MCVQQSAWNPTTSQVRRLSIRRTLQKKSWEEQHDPPPRTLPFPRISAPLQPLFLLSSPPRGAGAVVSAAV